MKNFTAALLVALACSACAKKHNDTVTQPVVVPPPAIVGNTYVGDCIPALHNEFFRTSLTFGTDAKRVQHVEVADNADCSKPSYSADITSQYNTSGMISEGVLAVDYTLIGITLTPTSDGLTHTWNRGGFCQSNSWEVGKPATGRVECLDRDIFNDVDAAQVFSVVQIAGDDIHLGEKNFDRNEDGHTTASRFTKIALETYHKKGAALQPTAPIVVGQCPVLAASYSCGRDGDEAFANRMLAVSVNGAEITVVVKARGQHELDMPYKFIVDGQPRQSGNGRDFTETKTASCKDGQLDSTDSTVHTGPNPFSSKTFVSLRTGSTGVLGIEVGSQSGNDPVRQSPRTLCTVF